MKRKVTVHPSASCKLTPRAHELCQQLNDAMRWAPNTKFETLAYIFGLSSSSARRYYYGMHERNSWSGNYNQVRLGACVDLY